MVRAMEQDDLPRMRGDLASRLAGESLDACSRHELAERIALLEAEIARTRAHMDKAADHRKLAESLFKSGESG